MCFGDFHVSAENFSNLGVAAPFEPAPPLVYLGIVDSNTTSLCTSTIHLHDLVCHLILRISGSVRAYGNQCRREMRAEGLNGTNLVETESDQDTKREDITKDC